MSAADDWNAIPVAPAAETTQAKTVTKPKNVADEWSSLPVTQPEAAKQVEPLAEQPSKTMSALAGAGKATGSAAMAIQQLLGKGLTSIGEITESPTLQKAGGWLNKDAIEGALKLQKENLPYEQANIKSNIGGQIAGLVLSPINKLIPGGAATTLPGGVLAGTAQGAALTALTTPVTGEEGQGSFLEEKAKQLGLGAIGGGIGGGLGYGLSKVISKGIESIKNISGKLISGDTSQAATDAVDKTVNALGVDKANVPQDALEGMKAIVKKGLDSGNKPDPNALERLARAHTLDVPVPMTTGQITRDPLQFALEQNLRGIQGIGEPITQRLQEQNRALIQNLDVMGAKDGPDVITAGKSTLDSLKTIDDNARSMVSQAYDNYRNATGRDLDISLTGLAQDYAKIKSTFEDKIPSAIKNKFEDLGLIKGTQQKTFSITDAEQLIQDINANYDPKNVAESTALDRLRNSVQNAIEESAGKSAEGTAAAGLAKEARQAAKARFQAIDNTPAYKDAISGIEPDKFIQKRILQGNVGEIKSMVNMLRQNDPEALGTLQNSVMTHIKNQVTNGATDENAIFSQAKMKQFVTDPYTSARLQEVLGGAKMAKLKQLHQVAEDALYAPKASAVNTSNTAAAAANIVKSTLENAPGNTLFGMIANSNLPFAKSVAGTLQSKVQGTAISGMVKKAVSQEVGKSNEIAISTLPYVGKVSRIGASYAEEKAQRKRQE